MLFVLAGLLGGLVIYGGESFNQDRIGEAYSNENEAVVPAEQQREVGSLEQNIAVLPAREQQGNPLARYWNALTPRRKKEVKAVLFVIVAATIGCYCVVRAGAINQGKKQIKPLRPGSNSKHTRKATEEEVDVKTEGLNRRVTSFFRAPRIKQEEKETTYCGKRGEQKQVGGQAVFRARKQVNHGAKRGGKKQAKAQAVCRARKRAAYRARKRLRRQVKYGAKKGVRRRAKARGKRAR